MEMLCQIKNTYQNKKIKISREFHKNGKVKREKHYNGGRKPVEMLWDENGKRLK